MIRYGIFDENGLSKGSLSTKFVERHIRSFRLREGGVLSPIADFTAGNEEVQLHIRASDYLHLVEEEDYPS